jgi:hypothetical protein
VLKATRGTPLSDISCAAGQTRQPACLPNGKAVLVTAQCVYLCCFIKINTLTVDLQLSTCEFARVNQKIGIPNKLIILHASHHGRTTIKRWPTLLHNVIVDGYLGFHMITSIFANGFLSTLQTAKHQMLNAIFLSSVNYILSLDNKYITSRQLEPKPMAAQK